MGSLSYWILVCIGVLVPLAVAPQTIAFCEPIKITIFKVSVIALVAGWAMNSFREGSFRYRRGVLDLPVAALLLWGAVGVVFALNRHDAFYGAIYRYDGWLQLAMYAVVYWAIGAWLRSSWQVEGIVRWLVAAGAVAAAYAGLQRFGIDPIDWSATNMDLARPGATFGSAQYLGAFLALTLPLAAVLAATERGWRRLAASVALALTGAALLGTFGRAAWIGGLSGVLLLLLRWMVVDKSPGRGRLPVWLPAIGVAAAVVMFLTISAATGGFAKLTERVVGPGLSSVQTRMDTWTVALEMMRDRPLTGFGQDNFVHAVSYYRSATWKPDRPHNVLLQAATSSGFPGLVALMWLVVAALWSGSRRIAELEGAHSLILAGLVASLAAYYVQAQAGFDVVSVTPVVWIVYGLTARYGRGRVETLEPPWSRAPHYATAVVIGVVAFIGMATAARPLLADVHQKRAWEYRKEAERSGRADLMPLVISEIEAGTSLNTGEARYFVWLGTALRAQYHSTRTRIDFVRARTAFETAVRLEPRNTEALFNLGLLERESAGLGHGGSFVTAAGRFYRLTRIDPSNADYFYQLGVTRLSAQEPGQAAAAAKTSVRLNPKGADAWYLLSRAYEAMGENKKAGDALRRARRLAH